MNDTKVTTEHLQAIERWENEGGKVSPALRIMRSRQEEVNKNEEPVPRELIVARKKRPRDLDIWARWRWA